MAEFLTGVTEVPNWSIIFLGFIGVVSCFYVGWKAGG